MITQEQFKNLEYEHGCGYWNLCWEHACPCAITIENKGLQQCIWDSMVKENKEIAEEYSEECEKDDNYYEEDDPYDDFDWEYDDYEEEYECPFCHQIIDFVGMCNCSERD